MNNSFQNSEGREEANVKCHFSVYIDESGDLMFACGWGDGEGDIEDFAALLFNTFDGHITDRVISDIKSQCGVEGSADFSIFKAYFDQFSLTRGGKEDDIVVNPLSVHP